MAKCSQYFPVILYIGIWGDLSFIVFIFKLIFCVWGRFIIRLHWNNWNENMSKHIQTWLVANFKLGLFLSNTTIFMCLQALTYKNAVSIIATLNFSPAERKIPQNSIVWHMRICAVSFKSWWVPEVFIWKILKSLISQWASVPNILMGIHVPRKREFK